MAVTGESPAYGDSSHIERLRVEGSGAEKTSRVIWVPHLQAASMTVVLPALAARTAIKCNNRCDDCNKLAILCNYPFLSDICIMDSLDLHNS